MAHERKFWRRTACGCPRAAPPVPCAGFSWRSRSGAVPSPRPFRFRLVTQSCLRWAPTFFAELRNLLSKLGAQASRPSGTPQRHCPPLRRGRPVGRLKSQSACSSNRNPTLTATSAWSLGSVTGVTQGEPDVPDPDARCPACPAKEPAPTSSPPRSSLPRFLKPTSGLVREKGRHFAHTKGARRRWHRVAGTRRGPAPTAPGRGGLGFGRQVGRLRPNTLHRCPRHVHV